MTVAVLDLAGLTGERMSAILRAADLLGADRRVTEVRPAPLGHGQTADSFRLHLRYDEDGAGPAGVVAKVASSDEATRVTARRCGWYRREAGFYETFAPHLDVRVPRALHVSISDDEERYLLVLEDLAEARVGDQLAGVTVAEAASVLEQAAALHARHWGDPELENLGWLNRGAREWPAFGRRVPCFFEAFCARHGDGLSAEELAVGEHLARTAAAWFGDQPHPWALQHGDLRPDNVLFGAGDAAVLLDWQTLIAGPPLVDIAYFLGGGMDTDVRRTNERDLLRVYADALRTAGVSGYDADRCFADYARAAPYGWYMAIASAVTVERTERGDRMFTTMARRHAAHARETR